MITGYGHFVQLAETLQWDETAIDLDDDIKAWPELSDADSERISGLIAGFCIAEMAVASHLANFEAAATVDDAMAGCFKAQARDEARHARFFDRVAVEVVGVPGSNASERGDALRDRVGPELVSLFEEQLPDAAQKLAEDHSRLTNAVGLYHMVLEGVVLLAGQQAMIDTLTGLQPPLPGLRKGMDLVLRDERWHIGFGSRVIQSADLHDDTLEEILSNGEAAAKSWGALTTPEAIDKAAQLHRRRLKSVGIKFW